MTNYVSEAKDALLGWAADHSDAFQKWGEYTKYAGVGVGLGSIALMKYLGIEDPGVLSRGMVVPAAVVFGVGEGVKVLGEYARDVERGETNPVKNYGYVARVFAPVCAAVNGADGVWDGIRDIAVPIGTWVAGAGASGLGQMMTQSAKREAAESVQNELERKIGKNRAKQYLINHVEDYNPNAIRDTVARDMPLKKIKDFTESTELYG